MRPGCGAGRRTGAAASRVDMREEIPGAQHTPYGSYVPGTRRVLIATRFHALIAITAIVSAASSASPKCLRTSS